MNAPKIVRLFFVPAILSLLAAEAPGLADTTKGMSRLVRPDPVFDAEAVVPDTNARGSIAMETKISTGRDRLTVVVKNVDSALSFNLFIEDPDDADPKDGVFTNSPPIALTGNGSAKKLKLDTDKGDALPFGVTDWEPLQGLQVRIVVGTDPEADASIYLIGRLPVLGASKVKVNAIQDLSLALGGPDPDATGTVRVFSQASTGDERVFVKVKKLDFNSNTFELWIQDGPGAETYSLAGPLVAEGKVAIFERRTRTGQAVPMGEASAAAFSGRIVQVRNQLDVPFLSALIPQVN